MRALQSKLPSPNGEDEPPSSLYGDLKLAIEYVPVGSLKGYGRNARTHSPRQIGQIAESIRAFGFVSPILIAGEGEIIAGHGRHAAAKLLKLPAVPVVRIEHLDEAQTKALRIADNRLAELAGWDRELLALEFKDLLELDLSLDLSFDLAITGFEQPEIDQLMSADQQKGLDPDDQAPEPDREGPPVSQVGDLWFLGENRLICGDAREQAVFAALLGDERAAVGIHDAPYNVSVARHVSRSGRHSEFVMGVGEMSEAEFTRFNQDWLTRAVAHSRPGAIQYAFMDWRHMQELMSAAKGAGLELKNLAVWDKGTGAMGSLLRSQHELVFLFKDPHGPSLNNVQLGKFGRNRTNVWKYPGATSLRKELELHPTPKPVALVADAIRDVSNRNDVVLDCFSGSGTTIIAAARCGRRARVIELDPHYVDVAVRRWETWSGESARHARGGSFAETAASRRSAVKLASPGQAKQETDSIPAPAPAPVRPRPRPRVRAAAAAA